MGSFSPRRARPWWWPRSCSESSGSKKRTQAVPLGSHGSHEPVALLFHKLQVRLQRTKLPVFRDAFIHPAAVGYAHRAATIDLLLYQVPRRAAFVPENEALECL